MLHFEKTRGPSAGLTCLVIRKVDVPKMRGIITVLTVAAEDASSQSVDLLSNDLFRRNAKVFSPS